MSQSARLQQQFAAEDSVLKTAVLEILHRPQSQSVSLKHIARELASRYDPREVERCLIKLSEEGLAELVYTSGYDVGVRARPLKHW